MLVAQTQHWHLQVHRALLPLQNVTLWSSIRAALHREGHLKPPRVHVHASCGQQADQLQRMVSDMGGEVAHSAGEHLGIKLYSGPTCTLCALAALSCILFCVAMMCFAANIAK